MSKSAWIVVIILLLGGIGLIVYTNMHTEPKGTPATQNQGKQASSSTLTNSKPLVEDNSAAMARIKLVKDLVSQNPWPDTSKMKDYSAAVSRASVDTQEIDVTSCAPNPPVAHVTLGKAVVFSNHDSVVRGLGYGDKLQIDVPAKSQQTVTPTFKSPGIYPYRCGQDFAGIFLVTP